PTEAPVEVTEEPQPEVTEEATQPEATEETTPEVTEEATQPGPETTETVTPESTEPVTEETVTPPPTQETPPPDPTRFQDDFEDSDTAGWTLSPGWKIASIGDTLALTAVTPDETATIDNVDWQHF